MEQAHNLESDEVIRNCLSDLLSLIDGTVPSSVIESRWVPGRPLPPDDPTIDLVAFRPPGLLEGNEEHRFLEHINTAAPLEMVLKGHLWVETVLIRLLEDLVQLPREMEEARLSFVQKVRVACALGAISSEVIPSLLTLNRLRNKVAHDLDAAIGAAEEQALIDSLDQRTKLVAGVDTDDNKNQPFPHRFQLAIFTLVTVMDSRRCDVIAGRRYDSFLHHVSSSVLGSVAEEPVGLADVRSAIRQSPPLGTTLGTKWVRHGDTSRLFCPPAPIVDVAGHKCRAQRSRSAGVGAGSFYRLRLFSLAGFLTS